MFNRPVKFLLLLAIPLFSASCIVANSRQPTGEPSLAVATATASQIPATATPEPQIVYLQLTDAGKFITVEPLRLELTRLAEESGYVFAQGAEPDPIPPQTAILVTTASGESISGLLAERPQLKLIALGAHSAEPNDRLTVIGPDGFRFDRVAFMAAYLGAMLVPDHRTAMLVPPGEPDSSTWRAAYRAGQQYYCGLCRPAYPPFEDYPIFVALEGEISQDQIASSLALLSEQSVRAVYLPPMDGLSEFDNPLAGTTMAVFTAHEVVNRTDNLTAVIRPAPELVIAEIWPSILSGEAPASVAIPLIIDPRDTNRLNEARMRVAREVLDDLNSGFITLPGAAE